MVNLAFALVAMIAAAFAGNVVGYEIGRKIGPPLYEHDGRILKREYFTKTEDFFEKHGRKALVIGRFVPFVRTYITWSPARPRWSAASSWSGASSAPWPGSSSIMLIGYFVGQSVPWLANNIDYVILGLLALSVVPVVFEWWRHRGDDDDDDARRTPRPRAAAEGRRDQGLALAADGVQVGLRQHGAHLEARRPRAGSPPPASGRSRRPRARRSAPASRSAWWRRAPRRRS